MSGSIRVAPPTSTRMTGTRDAMQLESSFLEALFAADQAMIEGDVLVLQKGGRVLLRFDRVTRG